MKRAAAAAILLVGSACQAERPPVPAKDVASVDGRDLYARYGCASCHGADASGNGPMAARLRVQPPDLRRDPFRYGGTPEEIANTIAQGGFPGAGMPSFPDIPEGERTALAAFVLSLRERPAGTPGGS